MLALLSTSVPLSVTVSAPDPVTCPVTVSVWLFAVSNVPPPLLSVTVGDNVNEPVAASVPLLKVRPVVPPRSPAAATLSVAPFCTVTLAMLLDVLVSV